MRYVFFAISKLIGIFILSNKYKKALNFARPKASETKLMIVSRNFMTTQKFHILLTLFLALLGCQQNPDNKIKSVDKPQYHCSRIIISFYDNTTIENKSYKNYGPFSTERIYETVDQKVLADFEQMTKQADRTSYCCCPERNYTISFYDKTTNFKDYFVDTVEYKDKVIIYQASYQFSYIVDKIKWSKFLSKLDIISFNEYSIYDLTTARRVYKYTIQNNLPIITSKRASSEWMTFDGDFKVKVVVVGENLDESKIFTNIKKAYPSDTFKIKSIGHYSMSGSYDGHDSYHEVMLQIFCNKNFYNKFKIYSPISFYDEAHAEFYILGRREKLNKIDEIAQKEE